MSTRLVAALVGLAFCSIFAGHDHADAADLSENYESSYAPVQAHRSARSICVAEHGPDAPPYGYGCLDHWVKIRKTRDVIQDNGYGYTTTTTTVRRRYPPQYYFPQYVAEDIHVADSLSYRYPSPLGCPSCE